MRIGLAGCGRWGRNILRDLVAAGVTVTVADPDAARWQEAVLGGASSVVASVDELPDVDAIVVSTPASTHASLLDALAERRIPIACEKPLTADAASARRVAGRLRDRLVVLHKWRYHYGVELLRDLVRRGELGTVEAITTRRLQWGITQHDVSPIWTLAPHDLSLLTEILGGVPTPVGAVAGGEEWLRATLRWSEVLIDCEFSIRFPSYRREIVVSGSTASAMLSDPEAGFVIVRHKGHDDAVQIPYPAGMPLRRELDAFLRFVRGGDWPKTSVDEAVRIVEVIEALEEMGKR